VELGKAHVIPFNIFIDAKYNCVKVFGDETTLRFSTVNLGKIIEKANALFIKRSATCWCNQCVNLPPHLA
jgi:hypothetical protein